MASRTKSKRTIISRIGNVETSIASDCIVPDYTPTNYTVANCADLTTHLGGIDTVLVFSGSVDVTGSQTILKPPSRDGTEIIIATSSVDFKLSGSADVIFAISDDVLIKKPLRVIDSGDTAVEVTGALRLTGSGGYVSFDTTEVTSKPNDRSLWLSSSKLYFGDTALGAGGGGSPGGSNTQLQYNDGGSFGGNSGLTYEDESQSLTIGTPDSKNGYLQVYNNGDNPLVNIENTHGTAFIILSATAGQAVPGLVGIGVADPDVSLEVYGPRSQIKISENDSDNTTFDHRSGKFTISVDGGGDSLILDARHVQVGKATFGVESPRVAFEVHYSGAEGNLNPAQAGNLSNNEGGGEVIYFGTGNSLEAGKLYVLSGDSTWVDINAADAADASDPEHLLAISIGTVAGHDGMIMRGFFNVETFFSGTFIPGHPVYIHSGASAGCLTNVQPSGSGAIVRACGYSTTLANVVYFNPSSTYIEID